MAYTQTDLDNIDQAIINLVTLKKPVRFVIDGEVVEYPVYRLADLRSFRAEVAAAVAESDSDSDTIHQFVVHGSKGL